jgi:hypothetical protein
MKRRNFLTEVALATCGVAAFRNVDAFGLPQAEDAPNQHNMLVVGEQIVYLSHLPMFQGGQSVLNPAGTEFTSPHRFQVILEATFSKQGKNVTDLYVKDRQSHKTTRIYTLEPNTKQPFILSRVFTPPEKPQLQSFTGTVFRGHLEQGGQPIAGLSDATVEIKRVAHASKFDPKGPKPSQLQYIVFGKGPGLFAAHAISGPPDFDQVFAIKVSGHEFTADELNRAVRIVVPDRKNVVTDRLREGQTVPGQLTIAPSTTAMPVQLQAVTQFYFEEGELQTPPTFKPTQEEMKG